jgi:Domain of unknown function (DUF4365)
LVVGQTQKEDNVTRLQAGVTHCFDGSMPITTSTNDIKERLSLGYLHAVAAGAGCQVAHLPIDKESVDAIIRPVRGSARQIDIQMKATSLNIVSEGMVSFSLPIKNYDDLRDTNQTNPHYLVVLHLPGQLSDWLAFNPTELVIRGVAYFRSLHGEPAIPNTTNRVVTMPQTQRFTADVLREMIRVAPQRV